ncbi:MAG TPA: alpha/beta fold hydrolase [Noviherbaspirillum sp.]
MNSLLSYRLRKLQRGVLAKVVMLSPRLAPVLKTETTLARLDFPADLPSSDLLVFLPGIGDLAEDFVRSGFIADLRRHGISADAVAIDAHYGYYASRAIHTRIAEDVIAAAQDAGYERIWLTGISLGGFGATSFAALHSSHIAGLLLLAPYLGTGGLVNEIASAGGIRNWEPGDIREDDYMRAVWAWLKNAHASPAESLPIYLGYGESDMFARANSLLADVLPDEHVHSIPGGHDWRTWKKLWQQMLPTYKATQGRF